MPAYLLIAFSPIVGYKRNQVSQKKPSFFKLPTVDQKSSTPHSMNQDEHIFNSQLRIYRKILVNNYMEHHQFYQSLHDFLVNNFSQPFSLLELGCGDASFMSRALLRTQVNSYTGVDLSNLSLQNAAKNMQIINCEQNFIQANLLEIIPNLEEKNQLFDGIFTGFVLHHLSFEQKAGVFEKISKLLTKNGIFLFMDVMRKTNETREQYLQKYLNYVGSWQQLNPEEMNLVKNHIISSDFPETEATIYNFAQDNFQKTEELYKDNVDTARFLVFYKS
jgi:ubiquinone/menaquinone biosynthesis C-methylase UbiE